MAPSDAARPWWRHQVGLDSFKYGAAAHKAASFAIDARMPKSRAQ